jgi:Coenzyme PQQ synthesis protein D (PqqD)
MTERLRLREGVHWREADGQVIGLDLTGDRYLSVNRSGALLWSMLQEGTTRDALVNRLADEFGLSPEGAGADVDAWLEVLQAERLLVRVE